MNKFFLDILKKKDGKKYDFTKIAIITKFLVFSGLAIMNVVFLAQYFNPLLCAAQIVGMLLAAGAALSLMKMRNNND